MSKDNDNLFDDLGNLEEDLSEDRKLRKTVEDRTETINQSDGELFVDMMSIEDEMDLDDRVLFNGSGEVEEKKPQKKKKRAAKSDDDLFGELDDLSFDD